MYTLLWLTGLLWVVGILALYIAVARRDHQQNATAAKSAVRRAQQERLRRIARLPHERDGK